MQLINPSISQILNKFQSLIFVYKPTAQTLYIPCTVLILLHNKVWVTANSHSSGSQEGRYII